MKISTRLLKSDYIKVFFSLYFRRPIIIIVYVAYILFLFSFPTCGNGGPAAQPYDSGDISLMVFTFIVLALPVMVYFVASRSYNSSQRLKEPVLYEFTDNMMRVSGTSFSGEKTMDKLYKIRETKKFFLLYESKNIASIIPKKDMTSQQITELRELLRNVPGSGKKKLG